jgi:hypothetical protein
LQPRNVEVLRATRHQVILRAGLEAGEKVCTTPLDVVVSGMKVRTGEAALNSISNHAPNPEAADE